MNKTINGTTNNQYWTYKLVVTETTTDITNRTSTIKVEHFLGRKSGSGASYFNGAYTIKSTINGETKTSNKNTGGQNVNVSSGGWKSIGSHTFTVPNTGNPTTISISGQQTSSIFTPSSSSANGTMDLTVLHLPPHFTNISIAELNQTLINLGIGSTEIVYYLSIKKFTITATTYDSASITTYNVYNNNVLIGTSNTNEVTVDFANVTMGNDGVIRFEVIDSLQGSSFQEWQFSNIEYTKPTLELSTTTIKRKTDSQTGLIDNIATLRLNGNYYAGDNVVGNNNTITKVEYKIWDATEPSYTDITSQATINNGVVTISGYDISNIDFEKTYDYKIVITDYFGNTSEIKVGKVPTGIAVWTEFKDRVDFIKLTINNKNITAPYILYEGNSSRTDKNITLSDSSANYDYLEIYYNYYASGVEHYNMTKIDEPNGKIAMLMGMFDNGTYLYEEVANYTINGGTLERTDATRWRFATGGGNSTRTNTTTNDPPIWITKVVGYK